MRTLVVFTLILFVGCVPTFTEEKVTVIHERTVITVRMGEGLVQNQLTDMPQVVRQGQTLQAKDIVIEEKNIRRERK
jgi:hypothetical protein